MKIKDLKLLLGEFDEDLEIILSDYYSDWDKDIFQLSQVRGKYGGESYVRLCSAPECVEDLNWVDENAEKTVFDIHSSFNLYDCSTGDYVNYQNGELNTIYHNISEDTQSCDEDEVYESTDFLTSGGLRKFFAGVPNGTPVNIKICGIGNLKIQSIRKYDCEYLCGTIDNVDYYNQTELFLIPSIELYGGKLLSLKDSVIWWNEKDEILQLIDSVLREFFMESKDINIVEEIYKKLCKYYHIHRRVNGSSDSNGLVHLYDENNPFMKYSKEDKED